MYWQCSISIACHHLSCWKILPSPILVSCWSDLWHQRMLLSGKGSKWKARSVLYYIITFTYIIPNCPPGEDTLSDVLIGFIAFHFHSSTCGSMDGCLQGRVFFKFSGFYFL